MRQTVQSNDIPDIKLPLYYIITGILFFVISQIIFLFTGQSIVHGQVHTPLVWASVHSFILGFAAMVAMGAMYQLVPVACQVAIYNTKWGYIQYFSFIVGVLGIVYSFLNFVPKLLMISGIITFISIIIFLFNMALTLYAAEASFIKSAINQSLVYLAITIWLGFWMAFDFLYPSRAIFHQKLLFVHIILGLNGWFALLIIGFSYKLIPMFSLSHRYESNLPQYSLWTINAGIFITVFSKLLEFNDVEYLGFLTIVTGYLIYMFQIKKILKKRLRKNLDLGLKVSLFSWVFALILLVSVLLVSAFKPINNMVYVYIVLMGWIGLNILGFLYKIVPFLWWTHKYSDKIGNEKVPMLKDMINEHIGKWIFLTIIAMNLFIIYTFIQHVYTVFVIAQVIIVISSILYTLQIILVILRSDRS